MAVIGTAVTLADLRKRMDPNGSVAQVADILNQTNVILKDALWKEGNLPTGMVVTQRTGLPSIGFRALNSGVAKSKSTTKQVVDTCCIIEGNSEIDVDILEIQSNKKAFRYSEDMAFVEKFNQTLATALMYGDVDTDPEKFNGLNKRFNALSTTKGNAGYQIISAGGSGSDNTSAWLVGWGDKSCFMVYPQGSEAGLEMNDRDIQRVTDSGGNPYYAYCTNFKWKPGFSVRDHRYIARVGNIDVSDLATFNSGSDTSPKLIDKMILAKNRIPEFGMIKPAWYVNETVYSWLEVMLINKNNVYITRRELQDQPPELFLSGIPVRKVDAILNTEAAIS